MNTLRLDNDYTRRKRPTDIPLSELLRRECRRKGYEFETTDLNSKGWGDVMWRGLAGIHSGEIKGAAEFVGDMDHCEAQLMGQIPNCDRPQLYIYGRMEEAPDGGVYVHTLNNFTGQKILNWRYGENLFWERDADAEVARLFSRRHFRRNYAGVRAKLARFSEMGVEVFEVPNLDALAAQLVAGFGIAQTEGTTFSRLIPQKFNISETDAQRRAFMLTLMGIQGAGVGEEVADAVANWLQNLESDLSLSQLCSWLHSTPESEEMLEKTPLRSGKRSIGPAAVKKLKEALGL